MRFDTSPTRPIVMGTNGMIASGHPLASAAGLRTLQQGGNALDAALTAAGVLAVVRPEACSVGGDMFLMYYRAADGHVESMNASGRAPAQASLEHEAFRNGMPAHGVHSASVPGVVRGWEDALATFGTIPLSDALQPAIQTAERGFPVSVKLAAALATNAAFLRECTATGKAYLRDGEPRRPGEILRLPDLANSLRAIAASGADEFYRGELGRRIVQGHQADGGLFTMEDFARQESVFSEPLSVSYRGHTVYNQRPVSLGTVLLQELRLAEGFDLGGMPFDSAERLHLMLEIKKLAFADMEGHITDPEFHDVPTDWLLSESYAAERRALIDPAHASAGHGAGEPARYGRHTTYLCVVDGQGNCASWIQTLFHGFGSGWMAPGTGLLLNDRMHGFSANPEHVNRLEGGKRTAHTLNAPILARDGRPRLVFGTPGGYGQVQSNFQMLVNFLDLGMDPQAMVEAPRWFSGAGCRVTIEGRFSPATIEGLAQRGHDVELLAPWDSVMGGAQAIMIDQETGVLYGCADPRREGYAMGW
ncbi:MAG: gamma-glutamyltransferase [Chloroflexi bacterium]|nr:gamma-glutamyltransferase [Chloroflexota bacterium]